MKYIPVKKIAEVLGSRVARNIYFWAIIAYTKLENIMQLQGLPTSLYIAIFAATASFFVVLSYVNNLWLFPRLFVRKRYAAYFGTMLPVLALSALGYVLMLKGFTISYPALETPDQSSQLQFASLVSMPVTTDFSAGQLFIESLFMVSVMAAWVLIFCILWFASDYTKQLKRAEALEIRQTETELSFLRSQINPHFLFNTLNNLYGLALKKSDAAPDSILKLSSILRYLLYESTVKEADFEKEKFIMQSYIDLELLRIGDSSKMHFDIEADASYRLAPLLWLPVLENVFKHGTRFINPEPEINFRFAIMGNKLRIRSENLFKLQEKEADHAGGIGLQNLEKRLSLLYPGRYLLRSHPQNNFYITEVEVELNAYGS